MRTSCCSPTRLGTCLVLCLLGCGKSGPQLPQCFPVSGKVLIDGQPAVRAMVGLHPLGPQSDSKTYAGSTFTGDDGAFRMTTFTAGDGVPAGDYTVTIEAKWISRNGADVGVPDLLGGQYADPAKSTLKVTVQDQPVELEPYDFKKASK